MYSIMSNFWGVFFGNFNSSDKLGVFLTSLPSSICWLKFFFLELFFGAIFFFDSSFSNCFLIKLNSANDCYNEWYKHLLNRFLIGNYFIFWELFGLFLLVCRLSFTVESKKHCKHCIANISSQILRWQITNPFVIYFRIVFRPVSSEFVQF